MRIRNTRRDAAVKSIIVQFLIILSAVWFLTACDNRKSPIEDGNSNVVALPMPSSLTRLNRLKLSDSNLQVKAIIGGVEYILKDLVIDEVNNTFSGTIQNVPKGEREIQLVYFMRDDDGEFVEVAETDSFKVSVSGGKQTNATVNSEQIVLRDSDGDGYSNLTEIDLQTNYKSATDFPVNVKPNVAPPVPVVSVGEFDKSVKLSWQLAGNADSFSVYYSEQVIDENNLQADGVSEIANATSPIIIPELENGKLYYITVVANNEFSNSMQALSATPNLQTSVPGAPINTKSNIAENKITLQWDEVQNAKDYSIYLSSQEITSENYTTVEGHSFAPITNWFELPESYQTGNVVYYLILANNGAGSSAATSFGSVNPVEGSSGGILLKGESTNKNVLLSWNAVPGAQEYLVFMAEDSEVSPENFDKVTGGMLHKVVAPATEFTHNPPLINGVTYYFVITAIDEDGIAKKSNRISLTPELLPPIVPQHFHAEGIIEDVHIKWEQVPNADKIIIIMAEDQSVTEDNYQSLPGGMRHEVAGDATEFFHKTSSGGLIPGTEYWFTAVAVNAAGKSNRSERTPAIPLAAPIVNIPNTVGMSLAEGLNELEKGIDQGEFTLKEPVSITSKVTTKPVEIINQTPVGSQKQGAEVSLEVSMPPDANQFLTLVHHEMSDHSVADIYYKTIDPDNERTTLDDWLVKNKFANEEGYTDITAETLFFNYVDHDFTRRAYYKKNENEFAFWVDHFETFEDGKTENNLIESVAIEYGPAPDDGSEGYDPNHKFVKFYAFGPDGKRVNAVDLDGPNGPAAAQAVPDLCVVCHGGGHNSVVEDSEGELVYAHNGDIGARLIPFNLDAFRFEAEGEFSRTAQEDKFRIMNQAVLDTFTQKPLYAVRANVDFRGNPAPKPIPNVADGPVNVQCNASDSENSSGTTYSGIFVAGLAGTTADVNVAINDLQHESVSDLEIILHAPNDGPSIKLFSGNADTTAISDLSFDDEATASLPENGTVDGPFTGSFKPIESLFATTGVSPNGTWTLQINDSKCNASGMLNNWSIHIKTSDSAAVELIAGWYGGTNPLEGNFNGSFVPKGWAAENVGAEAEKLYLTVIGESCRNCHLQHSDDVIGRGFTSFAEFQKLAPLVKQKVFLQGAMPRAWSTYVNFWSSPDQAETLASFMPNNIDGSAFTLTGPGRPLAEAGSTVIVNASTNTKVTLSGKNSLFATSFRWEVETAPAGSQYKADDILSDGAESDVVVNPEVSGDYIFKLTVANNDGSMTHSDTVTVADRPVNFSKDIYENLFTTNFTGLNGCSWCHGVVGSSISWYQPTAKETYDYLIANNANSVEESEFPYIDLNNPEESALLVKPSNAPPPGRAVNNQHHRGGIRPGFNTAVENSNQNYELLLRWINEGANFN